MCFEGSQGCIKTLVSHNWCDSAKFQTFYIYSQIVLTFIPLSGCILEMILVHTSHNMLSICHLDINEPYVASYIFHMKFFHPLQHVSKSPSQPLCNMQSCSPQEIPGQGNEFQRSSRLSVFHIVLF